MSGATEQPGRRLLLVGPRGVPIGDAVTVTVHGGQVSAHLLDGRTVSGRFLSIDLVGQRERRPTTAIIAVDLPAPL